MKKVRVAQGALLLVGVLLVVGVGAVIGRTAEPDGLSRVLFWAMASLVFGMLTGLSELLSRYRDEPILASANPFGIGYLLLNGLVSLAAFALLRRYPSQIFPVIQQDLLLTAVVAGFGSMAVFRSKLFTFRSDDGKDYAIGPAIVLDTVLKTIDRKIDRLRAAERQAKVFDKMKDLQDFENTAHYLEASLLSFQNLTQAEKEEISRIIDQYRKAPGWSTPLKIMAVGFAFLTIAGEENFDQVIAKLSDYLNVLKQQSAPTSPAGSPSQSGTPGAPSTPSTP